MVGVVKGGRKSLVRALSTLMLNYSKYKISTIRVLVIDNIKQN